MRDKEGALLRLIGYMGNALVAFSGGVDSTLLAAAAYRALGAAAAAVTVRSPLSARLDRADAERMARAIGIRHCYLDVDELSNPDFTANGPRKCYYCKKMRFARIAAFAEDEGFDHLLDGSNTDDLDDYRPGMEAMREFPSVSSPLLECGFTKDDVRALSKRWGLAVWSKPAAACLASRVAPPLPIERGALAAIDGAEAFLQDLLPPDTQVRVRHHGEIARIEAEPSAFGILTGQSREVADALRTIGYRYVTLDLGGYAMGSLNPRAAATASAAEGIDMGSEVKAVEFEGVRAVAKANVYYDGKVLSHTIFMPNGDRKTFGITFPGEYEFGTGDAEVMDVVAGALEIMHPGESAWKSYAPGASFGVPANSKFRMKCGELSEYVCSYIKG